MTNKKSLEIDMDDIRKASNRLLKLPSVYRMGFSTDMVMKTIRKYLKENPKFDYNDIVPFVISYKYGDEKEKENKTIISLIRKNCKNCSIIVKKEDGEAAIVIGKAADEICSKCKVKWDTLCVSKTGLVKIECSFPVNSKLKCFGGQKVIDILD